jgi:hypothetical protein
MYPKHGTVLAHVPYLVWRRLLYFRPGSCQGSYALSPCTKSRRILLEGFLWMLQATFLTGSQQKLDATSKCTLSTIDVGCGTNFSFNQIKALPRYYLTRSTKKVRHGTGEEITALLKIHSQGERHQSRPRCEYWWTSGDVSLLPDYQISARGRPDPGRNISRLTVCIIAW